MKLTVFFFFSFFGDGRVVMRQGRFVCIFLYLVSNGLRILLYIWNMEMYIFFSSSHLALKTNSILLFRAKLGFY